MKDISKRMKNAILQWFIFNVVVILLFLVSIFAYIIPKYTEISSKKQQLSWVNTELQNIKTKGIGYEEFISVAKVQYGDNAYVESILWELDETFYTQNFENNSSSTYEEFLEEKNQEILDTKNSEEYNARLQLLSELLPFYGENWEIQDSISDFDFINNIENILFTFNLISSDPIGIRSLEPVSFWQINSTESEGNTDAGMYSISIPLSLVGQKKDILDFLHYVENVGRIDIEDWVLQVYEDTYFTRFPENIYKWQVVDIESIVFPNYIDNSPEPVSTDLVTFINRTQARERYNIDIVLRFYVAGLPRYKIETFMQTVIEKNKEVTSRVGTELQKYQALFQNTNSWVAISAINEIKSLNFLLQEISSSVTQLQKKQFEPNTSLDEVYKEAISFYERLLKVEEFANKNIQQLETIR